MTFWEDIFRLANDARRVTRALTATFPDCDECGLPCITVERFALASTDGPVWHQRYECWVGHRRMTPE